MTTSLLKRLQYTLKNRLLRRKKMAQRIELPLSMENYRNFLDWHVIVVGCGGTGGYLVPNLARLVANSTTFNAQITLLDGDNVEQKNLKRQNFIATDLNKNKARVLAERYSAALGISIAYHASYVKSPALLEELSASTQHRGSIVVGCVDNHRTRQVIAEWFYSKIGRFWIDAGNEELTGQVVCGYNNFPYSAENSETFALPCVANLFEEINNTQGAVFNDEVSCAERALENPQNIITNILAANYLLTFLQQVLQGNPIQTHGVFFSATQGTTDAMLNHPSRLDEKTWAYNKDTK